MKKTSVIGVMGGGSASPQTIEKARRLGRLVAREEWILLNGGRDAGVMTASAMGASQEGGITVGVLPGSTLEGVSPHITIPIVTGLGNARNVVNVLSSDVVVAFKGGAGTISEIAIALKSGRPVLLIDIELGNLFREYQQSGQLQEANSPEDAIRKIRKILSKAF